VVFYGPKQGEELELIMNMFDLAIGYIRIHRKNLNINSEIKAREYFARGIPFISCGIVEDFPSDFKRKLQVPSDEKPINIEEVIQFYESIKNDDYTSFMRRYAEENLSWEAKFKPLTKRLLEIQN